MFHRIEVHVIDMRLIIPLITDLVLSEPPLPQGGFPMRALGVSHPFHSEQPLAASTGHPPFDQIPAQGKISVTRRRRP